MGKGGLESRVRFPLSALQNGGNERLFEECNLERSLFRYVEEFYPLCYLIGEGIK